MGADYYVADTQSGDHVDDPANPASSWSASATRRVDGGFEIVRRDPSRGEHDETSSHTSTVSPVT